MARMTDDRDRIDLGHGFILSRAWYVSTYGGGTYTYAIFLKNTNWWASVPKSVGERLFAEREKPHPFYGPCDAMGKGGECSVCREDAGKDPFGRSGEALRFLRKFFHTFWNNGVAALSCADVQKAGECVAMLEAREAKP